MPNDGQRQARRHLRGSDRYLSRGQPWCAQKKRQHTLRRPQRQEGLLIEVDPILPPMYAHLFRVLIAYSTHLLNAYYYNDTAILASWQREL
jgi:hypothetical protein